MRDRAPIGILMLDSQFPRIPGDMGHAATWDFPVLWEVVATASPDRVVRQGARGLVEPFIAAGHRLIARGARGITTTCGFLSLYQSALSEALGVPVATSSLMLVTLVNATLPPGRRTGILTISGETLSAQHLQAAGVPEGTPVGSTMAQSAFNTAILGNRPEMDLAQARQDVVAAAERMQRDHHDLGALVLECTNMTPYANDIAHATGLPVHTIVSFITWFQSGLTPATFEGTS